MRQVESVKLEKTFDFEILFLRNRVKRRGSFFSFFPMNRDNVNEISCDIV